MAFFTVEPSFAYDVLDQIRNLWNTSLRVKMAATQLQVQKKDYEEIFQEALKKAKDAYSLYVQVLRQAKLYSSSKREMYADSYGLTWMAGLPSGDG